MACSTQLGICPRGQREGYIARCLYLHTIALIVCEGEPTKTNAVAVALWVCERLIHILDCCLIETEVFAIEAVDITCARTTCIVAYL